MSRTECSLRRWALAVVGCLAIAAGTARTEENAAAVAAAEDWAFVLNDALGEGRDLELYIAWKDGRVEGAFAQARRFNRMCYAVELKEANLTGARFCGAFGVTIPCDGWVPAGGKPLVLTAKVDAAVTPGGFDGTYEVTEELKKEPVPPWKAPKKGEAPPPANSDGGFKVTKGKLTATRAAPMAAGQVCRMALSCEDTINKTERMGSGRRLGMTLSCKDGRSFAGRLIPPGSMTDVAMAAVVEQHALQFDGRRLTGTLTGAVRRQGRMDTVVRYDFAFQGMVIAGAVGGVLKVTQDGQAQSDGCYVGRVTVGAPDPADALYSLTLHEALSDRNFLNVSFTMREGKVLGGFGTSPNFNNSIHTVDFSGIRLAGGRLQGPLVVTIVPDVWIPRDHKPVPCRYELDLPVADGALSGRFTGKFGDTDVAGVVDGNYDRKVKLERISGMTLKVESGAFSRAFLGMRFEDGKLVSSSVSNNHDRSVKGKVTEVKLDWSDERIRGSVSLEMSRGGSAPAGYTCQVDGILVGTLGAGVADTANLEGHRKASTFWVAISPEKE